MLVAAIFLFFLFGLCCRLKTLYLCSGVYASLQHIHRSVDWMKCVKSLSAVEERCNWWRYLEIWHLNFTYKISSNINNSKYVCDRKSERERACVCAFFAWGFVIFALVCLDVPSIYPFHTLTVHYCSRSILIVSAVFFFFSSFLLISLLSSQSSFVVAVRLPAQFNVNERLNQLKITNVHRTTCAQPSQKPFA